MNASKCRQRKPLPGFLYDYPFETVLSTGMLIIGGVLIARPYPLVERLGPGWEVFSVITGVLALLAGATTMIGLVRWWGWKVSGVEQLGLWLTWGLCSTYIYLMLLRYEERSISILLLLLGVALACVLRALGTRKEACERRELLRATNDLREEMGKRGTSTDGPP